jgi:hypothetical protein
VAGTLKSRTSILPVTASAINAFLYSTTKSISFSIVEMVFSIISVSLFIKLTTSICSSIVLGIEIIILFKRPVVS